MEESLLNNSLLGAEDNSTLDNTSIFGTDLANDTSSDTISNQDEVSTFDYDEEIERKKEEQRIIDEHNRRVSQTPEYKAQIVFNSYVQNNPYLSGQEKRRLKKECLRLAKKGKYDYLFDPEKIRKREEREQAKFDKLNKPKVYSVDDLSDETRATLEQMADASVVPAFNKETGSFES